jgi:Zn-dependent M16 (insulinase) family peptidase
VGRIFSHYLFNNESSPLRRALIDSKLGEDLDDMCGFEGDFIQGIFCAGLRKSDPKDAERIKGVIYNCLEEEVSKGLDAELLEGSMRQIEFKLREIIDGAHFPYHLSLAERAYRSWLYGGDPLAHLCFEEPLSILKKEKQKGTQFFVQKMRGLLLENTHNLLSVVEASSERGEMLGKKTEEQAAALSSSFTDEDKRKYYELTKELRNEQTRPPSAEALASLPKLDKSDLPLENEKVPVDILSTAGIPVYIHPLFTAGIIYLDIGFDLCAIQSELLQYFPLYSELLTRCGAVGKTYEQMARRISLSTGGISNTDLCATRFGTGEEMVFKSFFHGKSLPERFDEMLEIFVDIFCEPELDNDKQLRDILFEMRNDLNGAILRSGHHFAIAQSAARLSKTKYIDEMLDGVSQLRFLNGLIRADDMVSVTEAMKKLHDIIINRNGCIISVTYDKPKELIEKLNQFIRKLPSSEISYPGIDFSASSDGNPLGIEISSSVNYVAQSWGLEKYTPDAMGEFFLLSRNLSTGYLWDKVRVEGGAYGGMAVISAMHPVFSCASYRDPNLTGTLNNFVGGLEFVERELSREEVDQNIIGAIGRMDQPHSPHTKGFNETVAILCGRTREIRQQIRDAVLNSTPEALAKRASQILEEEKTAVTAFGSADAFNSAEKAGGVFDRENLLNNG